MPERLFGCHISSAGGLDQAAERARKLRINTVQVHASPPQRWNAKPFAPEVAERYLAARPKTLKKMFFHAIYLINLASPNKQFFHLSKLSLIHALDLCSAIRGEGVIVHVGSAVGGEKQSFKRAASGIDYILERAKGRAKLLLEVAAGSGAIIGDRFEELREIYDLAADKERLGFALDTQHMWASGYDLVSQLDTVVKNADRVLGLSNVKAIHLNDSLTPFGSKKDRHANLGEGTIGLPALEAFVNHKKLRTIPLILETPAMKEVRSQAQEVKKLAQLVA